MLYLYRISHDITNLNLMNRRFTFSFLLLCCTCIAGAREQLTNIPTVYIDTENSAPVTSKSDYVSGTVTVVSADRDECCDALPMGIRGRGNSTWSMEKKPYRVKFDKKTNFLNNTAKAKNWVFLANYADKTLIRNAIAFEISRFVGLEYTPSIKFVDVVLNDKYVGNYMVTDQTEVNPGRVPVEEQETTDTQEPEISGGYLLELDGFADGEPVWFQTGQGMKVTVKYPKDDKINEQQLKYITDYVCEFERRLFSDGFSDPEKGFRSMVDENSLVNWYIACELTANSDSFWSTYIYKKRNDDHIYFGPMWDYDIAFNNDNRLGNAILKLMRDHAHEPRVWIRRMWQDAKFRENVNKRWMQLVEEGIEDYLLDAVDSYAALIDDSQALNFKTWPVLNRRVYLENSVFPTYKEGVDYLSDFISERIAFLTESFAQTDPSATLVEINSDSKYLIRHSGGMYVGVSGSTCKLAKKSDAAEIRFIPSSAEPYAYGIELDEGLFMGSNKQWDVIHFNDFTDPYALFTVEKAENSNHVIFKNVGRGMYLGTDNNDAGGGIYTDKSGSDIRHRWNLVEIEQSSVDGLTTADKSLKIDGGLISGGSGNTSIRVFDVTGALVASGSGEVSVAPLSCGIYIASAEYADGTVVVKRFVKN